jgi:peroxiredoxin
MKVNLNILTVTAMLSVLAMLVPTFATADAHRVAPDFALKSMQGQNLRLSELRGEIVLVNFWTSRCGTCRDQLLALQSLLHAHADAGVRLLSVNFDSDPHRARDFVAGAGLEFPVLLDARRDVSRLYSVRNIPLLLLIDRDGHVRHVHDSHRAGHGQVYQAQLQALLQE